MQAVALLDGGNARRPGATEWFGHSSALSSFVAGGGCVGEADRQRALLPAFLSHPTACHHHRSDAPQKQCCTATERASAHATDTTV